MRAAEHATRRLIPHALAITAAFAGLTMAVGDTAEAKKLPFETGSYMGTTDQSNTDPIGFRVEKKAVTALFVDLHPPCYVHNPQIPMPPPSFAGLEGKIKLKKVRGIFGDQSRKRMGTFRANGPDGESFVLGWIKGRKAKGYVYDAYPGCPYDFLWEAKLSR